MPAITDSSMKQLLQDVETNLRKAIEENLDARLKPMQLKVDQLKARTEQQVATLTALRQELATRGGMDDLFKGKDIPPGRILRYLFAMCNANKFGAPASPLAPCQH